MASTVREEGAAYVIDGDIASLQGGDIIGKDVEQQWLPSAELYLSGLSCCNLQRGIPLR